MRRAPDHLVMARAVVLRAERSRGEPHAAVDGVIDAPRGRLEAAALPLRRGAREHGR